MNKSITRAPSMPPAERSATDRVAGLVVSPMGISENATMSGLGMIGLAVCLGMLSFIFFRFRNGFVTAERWKSSRSLRIVGKLLFCVPGLDAEREFAVRPHRYGKPEKLVVIARLGKIGASFILAFLASVSFAMGVLIALGKL